MRLTQSIVPRDSSFLATSSNPVAPNPSGSAFQTISVFNDLSGNAFPADPVRTHDVQMRFLGLANPLQLAVADDAVNVTPPGGTVALFDPGPHGFFIVQKTGSPIFPTDPVMPQTLHFSFSALFEDAAKPGQELTLPADPIYPSDPIFTLLPGDRSIQIDIYHQLDALDAVQHTHFSIDLDAAIAGSFSNVSAIRGSLDLGFDLTVNDPAAANALPAGTNLLTMTMTGNTVPEPALGLAAVFCFTLLRRRKQIAEI